LRLNESVGLEKKNIGAHFELRHGGDVVRLAVDHGDNAVAALFEVRLSLGFGAGGSQVPTRRNHDKQIVREHDPVLLT
jgi:hypothetical protein